MYTRPKLISFKLEGRELEKLIHRASEFGTSPGLFAKKLVADNLDIKSNEELMDRFDLLEDKLCTYIKEVFYVLSETPAEKLDEISEKIIPKKQDTIF